MPSPSPGGEPDWSALRAVVFDLDGTLVDSATGIAECLNVVARRRDRPPVSVGRVRELVSRGALELVGASLGSPSREQAETDLREFREVYAGRRSSPRELYDGVAAGLAALSRTSLRLGLCTNKPQALTERVLHDTGIAGFFQAVVGGDAVKTAKPDAGHLAEVARRLDLPLAATALVGDSEVDSAAAAAAGIPFVLVGYGYALGASVPCQRQAADFTAVVRLLAATA